MNIGFIGAGKVGCSLGKYFAEYGRNLNIAGEKEVAHCSAEYAEVKGYYSRSSESAQEAANFTESRSYESIEELIKACDMIFLTVPDSSIQDTWKQVKRYNIKGKMICHCSGVMSAGDAFGGIAETGAFGYSVHPLFAVSDKYNVYRELTGVFFTLEGGVSQEANTGLFKIRALLEAMGNPTCIIKETDKSTYHCAAAVASNLVCGLIDQSITMMKRCGFTEEDAVRALAPILTGNMEHIARKGPVASLTGPIERNDIHTIRKHLECLQDDSEETLYRLLSGRLIDMAQRRHPDRDYAEMSRLVRKEGQK